MVSIKRKIGTWIKNNLSFKVNFFFKFLGRDRGEATTIAFIFYRYLSSRWSTGNISPPNFSDICA